MKIPNVEIPSSIPSLLGSRSQLVLNGGRYLPSDTMTDTVNQGAINQATTLLAFHHKKSVRARVAFPTKFQSQIKAYI